MKSVCNWIINKWQIKKLINLFEGEENEEIKKQFEEAEKYRKANLLYIKNNQSTAHPQACYSSRLLNPFTKDLPKYDNINNISVEVTDFTKYVTLI